MTATVDAGRCIGCGMCAATAPEAFRMEGRVSTAYAPPDERSLRRAQAARDGCPVNAIALREP